MSVYICVVGCTMLVKTLRMRLKVITWQQRKYFCGGVVEATHLLTEVAVIKGTLFQFRNQKNLLKKGFSKVVK